VVVLRLPSLGAGPLVGRAISRWGTRRVRPLISLVRCGGLVLLVVRASASEGFGFPVRNTTRRMKRLLGTL
jgi:hypothetical protein